MIIGFHSIWSTYGMWLPNEPRGSWSTFVRSWDLYQFGPATKVETRRSIAYRPYDRNLKREMVNALKFPRVRFTNNQIQIVAQAILGAGYTIHALAVMPDHVHVVLGRQTRDIRKLVGHLKSDSTRALRSGGFFRDQFIWADHGWNVYLDTDEDLHRAIRYVEENPAKAGMGRQAWCGIETVRVSDVQTLSKA